MFTVNRDDLLRRLRRYCRENHLEFSWDARHGKGSHGRAYAGDRFTTVPAGEIRPGLLRAILDQLGLPPDAI